ncbi:MAG: glycosidase [Planctomycetota bacterium]|nr:MAG: glycosidase [Planctomycetota bacterium]
MIENEAALERLPIIIKPELSRVLLRPFDFSNNERITKIMSRVMLLSISEVEVLLEDILKSFSSRHFKLEKKILDRYEELKPFSLTDEEPSDKHKLLIGSYFLSEYSLEAAAIFNPSMILHPDQNDLPKGSSRYIISLRSTGEGHISSISFRECILDEDANIELIPASKIVQCPEPIEDQHYNKKTFSMKLFELGLTGDFTNDVLSHLGHDFIRKELDLALDDEVIKRRGTNNRYLESAEGIRVLARSNFRVTFDSSLALSEKVLFPHSPSQRKGIEDARFVRFVDDDNSVTYYATFTAYDGRVVLPELLETTDFQDFHIITLNGKAVQNKGMALFPRKINKKYYMLSRQDNENIFLMSSDNIHFWHEEKRILQPTYPWQFVQLGNCGSPIETKEGWLVLSHGVGPLRTYCIGAFLLDLEDPTKIIGRLREPLIKPIAEEREGYVPNVVYSCGAVIHNEYLFIPYAYSDVGSRFAKINTKSLLKMLLEKK